MMYLVLSATLSLMFGFFWQAFGWCSSGTKCPLSHDTDLIILQDEKVKEDKKKKRRRQKNKKRGRGEVVSDSSVIEGAPENKVRHIEVDPEKTIVDKQGISSVCPVSGPLTDRDGNTQQNVEENMKTDGEGNGVCEHKPESRNSATTAETNDGAKTKSNIQISECCDHLPKSEVKVETSTHRAGFDAFMTGYIFAYSCAIIDKNVEGQAEKEKEQTLLPSSINKVYLGGKATPLNIVKSTFSKSSKAHTQKMEMVWGGKM